MYVSILKINIVKKLRTTGHQLDKRRQHFRAPTCVPIIFNPALCVNNFVMIMALRVERCASTHVTALYIRKAIILIVRRIVDLLKLQRRKLFLVLLFRRLLQTQLRPPIPQQLQRAVIHLFLRAPQVQKHLNQL